MYRITSSSAIHLAHHTQTHIDANATPFSSSSTDTGVDVRGMRGHMARRSEHVDRIIDWNRSTPSEI